MKTLVWYRNDLRVADHAPLAEAARAGPAEAVFFLCAAQWRAHDVGDMRLAFLLRTLEDLAASLAELGVPFRVVDVDTFSNVTRVLVEVCRESGVTDVRWNAEYPLNERRRDAAAERALAAEGVAVHVHHGTVMQDPALVKTGAGKPYTVFTPFKRRWFEALPQDALRLTAKPAPVGPALEPTPLPDHIDGAQRSLGEALWKGGEARAMQLLARFVRQRASAYAEQRDLPGSTGTSVLSPYLAVGSVSPAQCAVALAREVDLTDSVWMSELVWREFYRHVVNAFDHVSMGLNFKRDYDALRWEEDADGLAAWQRGETGYPLVDAGMRQLNETGWMHNRVRMVTAMFLTKHLLIDWRHGERYFMQRLVDGDFASNNGGWQWSASTGTDATPYFRIFNPASQGARFDADGAYTRRWVPELAHVPDKQLFEPWRAPAQAAGYPAPIVEHRAARARALERFKAL